MEIYLIRHTAPLTEKGQIYGRTDVALADSFAEEKETIIAQLPANIDAIYTSPSSRCARLAEAVFLRYPAKDGQPDGAHLHVEEALYELDFGDWEGKTWDTIDRTASELWMSDFVHLSPPNGETMLQMERRIVRFWDRLLKLPYQHVCLVTHAGVIRILLARNRDIALKDSFSIEVAMGEVFRFSVSSF